MLYILLAAALCGADQAFKLWVKNSIPLYGSRPFLPGILQLTHVQNTGMAFSMLSGHTWLLALVSLVVIAGIVYFLLRGNLPRWEKLALALVLGGAAGNAIDRIFQGFVVDMFETLFVKFAVFNLADTFIDVGAAVFCVLYVVRTIREEKEAKAAASSKEAAGELSGSGVAENGENEASEGENGVENETENPSGDDATDGGEACHDGQSDGV